MRGAARLSVATAIVIAIGLGLLPAPIFAHELPFITLSVERGLPRSQVSALAADASGALWWRRSAA